MYFRNLFIDTNGGETQNLGNDIGSFIGDNIFLIAGLLIGIIVAILMRKNLNAKP